MKDKAGGAAERARGDRFGTNGAPRQSGGVPPECRDGKKCLQSNLRSVYKELHTNHGTGLLTTNKG